MGDVADLYHISWQKAYNACVNTYYCRVSRYTTPQKHILTLVAKLAGWKTELSGSETE